jgi:hypothetical protein
MDDSVPSFEVRQPHAEGREDPEGRFVPPPFGGGDKWPVAWLAGERGSVSGADFWSVLVGTDNAPCIYPPFLVPSFLGGEMETKSSDCGSITGCLKPSISGVRSARNVPILLELKI